MAHRYAETMLGCCPNLMQYGATCQVCETSAIQRCVKKHHSELNTWSHVPGIIRDGGIVIVKNISCNEGVGAVDIGSYSASSELADLFPQSALV